MTALLALDFGHLLEIEQLLYEVLALVFRFNNKIFYPIKKYILELIDIHLHFKTGRTALIIFKRLKEITIYITVTFSHL